MCFSSAFVFAFVWEDALFPLPRVHILLYTPPAQSTFLRELFNSAQTNFLNLARMDWCSAPIAVPLISMLADGNEGFYESTARWAKHL